MKQNLFIIICMTTINVYTQETQLNIPPVNTKNIVITSGVCMTTYAILKPGCSKQDIRLSFASAVLVVLPFLLDKKSIVGVNSTGINIKLKYKRYKCYKNPYKKNNHGYK